MNKMTPALQSEIDNLRLRQASVGRESITESYTKPRYQRFLKLEEMGLIEIVRTHSALKSCTIKVVDVAEYLS